jgi:hypothetical protein
VIAGKGFRHLLVFLTSITVAVFLVMTLVTMPRLEALGGSTFFDARLFGYDKTETKEIVGNLGAAGAEFYRYVQLPIDSAFAALFFITVSSWLVILAHMRRLLRFAAAFFIFIALVGMLADYLENTSVLEMIEIGSDRIDDELVMTGSFATVTKLICDIAVLATISVQGIAGQLRQEA